MSPSGPARVAVLGTGAIAQIVHLPTLSRMRGAEVVGLSDIDGAKAATLAQRHSVPRIYDSLAQLLRDDDVDAVFVCTPSNVHEAQVIDCLRAGKYVFCERPLALTEAGATRVLEAAGDSGQLMVGMNQRFRPDAAAMRKLLVSGELGQIRYLRTGWLNRRMVRPPRAWRLRKSGAGGGALMDLGLQSLDLALWLLGFPQPLRVVAHLHMDPGSEVEDSAVLMLELESGTVVTVEVTWTLVADREREYLLTLGEVGSASLPPLRVFRESDEGTVDVSPPIARSPENQFTASYREEISFFLDSVRRRRAIDSPVDQINLMRIVEAAYRSAEMRSEIVLRSHP